MKLKWPNMIKPVAEMTRTSPCTPHRGSGWPGPRPFPAPGARNRGQTSERTSDSGEPTERRPPAERDAKRRPGWHTDQDRRRAASRVDRDRPPDPVQCDQAPGVTGEHSPEQTVAEPAEQATGNSRG
jgi:hypothetical protein